MAGLSKLGGRMNQIDSTMRSFSKSMWPLARRLHTLGGTVDAHANLPVLTVHKSNFATIDPMVESIWATMGGKAKDYKIAEQAAALKEKKLPKATTPELICYLWLQQKGIAFDYQVAAAGGRSSTGGSVIDFLVRYGKTWAWRIQGSYWHGLPQAQIVDEIRRKLLVGAYAEGYQIDGVVDLWERSIYKDREYVFTEALSGYQLGET